MEKLPFNQSIKNVFNVNNKNIYCFEIPDENIDFNTVDSFGEEWSKFNDFNNSEIENVGAEYFDIVDFNSFGKNRNALDLGCGTGRWSIYLANKEMNVYSLDPSKAIISAANLTKNYSNITLINSSIDNIPFEDNSFDFVMSLGVLHHIPDTKGALEKCINKLKMDGTLLIYLYYSLDNRSFFYKIIFHCVNFIRLIICKLPKTPKKIICDLIAFSVYLPLVLISKLIAIILGEKWAKMIPLSYYRNKSMNIIRNDSLDRFGTPLEQRFSKDFIQKLLEDLGMYEIEFSNNEPYWHVKSKKR